MLKGRELHGLSWRDGATLLTALDLQGSIPPVVKKPNKPGNGCIADRVCRCAKHRTSSRISGYVKEIGPDDLIDTVRRIDYMVEDMEDELASQ